MELFWAIIIGVAAGIIAKLLVPGDRELSGFILTALLGVIGAYAALWASRKFGLGDGATVLTPVATLIGACVILGLWAVTTRRH